jgi:hypothetical protein
VPIFIGKFPLFVFAMKNAEVRDVHVGLSHHLNMQSATESANDVITSEIISRIWISRDLSAEYVHATDRYHNVVIIINIIITGFFLILLPDLMTS